MPRDYILERISDPELCDIFIAALRHQLQRRNRTAMRLYAEAHKLVGTQHQLAITVVQQLGARDEHDARRMIGMVREAESLSLEQQVLECAAFVAANWQAAGESRSQVASLLAPLMLVPSTNGERHE